MGKTSEIVYQTDFSGNLSRTDSPENQLLLADSWLVKHGAVIALDFHRERFFNSCQQRHLINPELLYPYWHEALERIPTKGLWFPRIELAGKPSQPKLQIRIRPAPALKETIRLSISPQPDKRKAPRHKGPDMPLLMKIRQDVLKQGADEGIVVSPKGYLLEGLTTSILWWEEHQGQKVLCTVPDASRILPGTTRRLILLIAEQSGIRVIYRRVRPEQLDGCEVWAVNALHGIRPAISWEKSPFTPKHDIEAHDRLMKWRHAIETYAVQLPA